MGIYRKKPVEIEAVQLASRSGDFTSAPRWFLDALVEADPNEGAAMLPVGKCAWIGTDLAISTLEGVMHASPGDWVIRGIKGELYSCKPDIFAATYEEHPARPLAFR